MSNELFPDLPGLEWGVTKRPVWKTVTHESVSGMELRSSVMTYPRYRITLSYEFLRSGGGFNELQQLIGFFNLRRGSWDDFLWLDPDDNIASGELFAVGNGAATAFGISRSYGGFREPIKDFNGVPSVFVGGVPLASPSQYTVANGVCTFNTAPADGAAVTWTGQFYKRVRFARDDADFEKFMEDLWKSKRVELITVKK